MPPHRLRRSHKALHVVLISLLSACTLLAACSDDGPKRAADGLPPTTTVSTLDAAVLAAIDLGAGYEEVPASPAVDQPCLVAIYEPTRPAARSFVSNAAQERIDLQVHRYQGDQSASGEFAEARSASSCRASRFGDAGGQPRHVEIEGAETSFDIGFSDQVDSVGITVSVVVDTVFVVRSTVHHGASTAEPLGAQKTAARVIARRR